MSEDDQPSAEDRNRCITPGCNRLSLRATRKGGHVLSGKARVFIVASIADPAAPTAAELRAGQEITCMFKVAEEDEQ